LHREDEQRRHPGDQREEGGERGELPERVAGAGDRPGEDERERSVGEIGGDEPRRHDDGQKPSQRECLDPEEPREEMRIDRSEAGRVQAELGEDLRVVHEVDPEKRDQRPDEAQRETADEDA
jgi:hypothetical protein